MSLRIIGYKPKPRGGIPPLRMEAAIDAARGNVEGVRFIDVSGGGYYPSGHAIPSDTQGYLIEELESDLKELEKPVRSRKFRGEFYEIG